MDAMMDNARENQVEQIVAQRQKLLRQFAIGFPLFLINMMLQDNLPPSWHGLRALSSLIALPGIFLFLNSTFRLNAIGKRLKQDTRLASAVNDERVQANWLKATATALGFLAALNGGVYGLTHIVPIALPAPVLAGCNLVVGMLTSVGIFLHLERKE